MAPKLVGGTWHLVLLTATIVGAGWQGPRGTCDVANIDKVDCGQMGSTQATCEASGCCWEPVRDAGTNTSDKGIPWCFYDSDTTRPPNLCDGGMNWAGTDPGFTDDFYSVLYDYYLANLNIEGSGAVVAAPDQETPGGSYYYHWMRDAGLSIKAWLDINDNDYNKVRTELDGYAAWVKKVQHKTDPNGIDVRIEPKFTIPDGEPYTGGWCRPQTDGPALRAMAMSKWGMIVKENGGDVAAIWDVVSYDMEWVLENWGSEGCDLWEEVRSDDFYFNRMAYVYSLNEAAKFADAIGESAGAGYRSTADTIATATKTHWKDGFLYESTNRPYDGAVIHSIATFGEYLFPPESEEAAATIAVLTKAFCNEYPINQQELAAGKAGILIGRYPNDSYAGGNPWQLLTAVLGELFYLGGQATMKKIRDFGADFALSLDSNREWMSLLRLQPGATANDLARAQVAAGDAVMSMLYDHVKDDGGQIDEQIDKNTGKQSSAEFLTWSYANILHALHVRKNLDPGELTTGEPTTPTTTEGTGPTQPTSPPTTEGPPATCCNEVKFVSEGGIADKFPEYVGRYMKMSTDSTGRKVFQKIGGGPYLHYIEDLQFKYETWAVTSEVSDMVGDVINDKKDDCVDASGKVWSYLVDGVWSDDATAQVICDGDATNCCASVTVASTGGVAARYPDLVGTYTETYFRLGGHPVYSKGGNYLYFLQDIPHHFEGWTIASSLAELGPISNLDKVDCVDATDGGWEYLDENGAWASDASFTVTC